MYRVDEYDGFLANGGIRIPYFRPTTHCGVIVAIITQLHAHIPPDAGRWIQVATAKFNFPKLLAPILFRLSHRSLRQQNLYCYGSSSFQQKVQSRHRADRCFSLSTRFKGAETKSGLDVVICVIQYVSHWLRCVHYIDAHPDSLCLAGTSSRVFRRFQTKGFIQGSRNPLPARRLRLSQFIGFIG